MFLRRRPSQDFAVMTSTEVLDQRLPVTRVFHFMSGGWMFVSGREGDESEPVWVHYGHVEDLDPSLTTLHLRRGRYALRHEVGRSWYVFGPCSDEQVDELLDDGTIDHQHNNLRD